MVDVASETQGAQLRHLRKTDADPRVRRREQALLVVWWRTGRRWQEPPGGFAPLPTGYGSGSLALLLRGVTGWWIARVATVRPNSVPTICR